MGLEYKASKHAIINNEPGLTEQEHHDSCDINKMVAKIAKGQMVRGATSEQVYGFDDMNADYISVKSELEARRQELTKIAQETEFTQAELDLIPESIRKEFNFKLAASVPETLNDDKTTKKVEEKQASPKT